MLALQSASLQAEAAFRTKPIESHADALGRRSAFVDPLTISKFIERLAESLRPLWVEAPAFAAAAAMTVAAAIHPFMNGNGRMSRILFNQMLQESGLTRSYLPLYEIGLVTGGAWLLALRRAQQQGDWEHMMRYLAQSVILCRRLQTRLSQ
ncbi:MAG TPA: Fic family protein [Allosphingosinicella sp.]|jgi:Fic family protein